MFSVSFVFGSDRGSGSLVEPFVFEIRDGNSDFTRLRNFVNQNFDVILEGNVPVYVTGYNNTSGAVQSDQTAGGDILYSTTKALESYGLSADNLITEVISGSRSADQPVVVVRISIPESLKASAKEWGTEGLYVRTNMLFLLGATLNAGVEWRFKDNASIMLNGGFVQWQWDNGMRRYYVWYLFPEYRCYLGSAHRWYVGLQGQYGEADVMLGTSGYQGEFYGGSVTGGYNLPIGRKLSLDFNLGLGYTTFKHDKYVWGTESGTNKNVRVRTEKDRRKNMIGPNGIGVNLVWHISR